MRLLFFLEEERASVLELLDAMPGFLGEVFQAVPCSGALPCPRNLAEIFRALLSDIKDGEGAVKERPGLAHREDLLWCLCLGHGWTWGGDAQRDVLSFGVWAAT